MKKKRFMYAIFIFLYSLCMNGNINAKTVEEIKIDNVNFPDAIFRERVSYYDTDKNGYLSGSELTKITSIYFDGGDNNFERNVASLKGIEYLTDLKSIDLHETNITRLDLSENLNLMRVSILNPNTEELKLPSDSKITEIRISNYQPNEIDVGMCSELKKLQLVNCMNITVLDVTNNNKIKSINISRDITTRDKLRQINIGKKEQLKYLLLNKLADLSKISIDKTPILDGVYITNCGKLKSINTTKMPKLRKLRVERCGLKTLNITKNTKLQTLNCSHNKLTKLNVRKNKLLKILKCHDNKIKSLKLNKNKRLVKLNCKNNNIKYLNICNIRHRNIRCDKKVMISK